MDEEKRQCQNCKKDFIIESDDFLFYEKMKVPAPTFCPECRLQRRLSHRNERMLYHRACDLCGENVISVFHSQGGNTVYCQPCWWSDKWDPMSYGKDYDFTQPFFKQYKELSKVVPNLSLNNANSVNSEYTHLAADNKDCYMLFESSNNERCNHSYWMQLSKDCLDCAFVNNSELCYEVFSAWNCYKLFFSKECRDCTDSYFLKDCVGCSNCYGCVGLRQKQYHIFNKPYSKEDYAKLLEEKKEQIKQGNFDMLLREFKDFSIKHINKYAYIQKSVNSTGDYLFNTKNCIQCFHGYEAEDCKYGYHVWRGAKNIMDASTSGREAELIYESINTGIKAYDVKFGIQNWNGNNNLSYCQACSGSSNLFGCIGLNKKQYCILNKQYTKEEYEVLLPKIIQHMKDMPYKDANSRTYVYGDFFPSDLAPFAYNESIAQEYYPLSKEQILEYGFLWKEAEARNYGITMKNADIPDNIKTVGDEILNQMIECEHQGKCLEQCTEAFRITPYELSFYKRMSLPLPRLCPNCRHYQRINLRNPLKLWDRKCMHEGCQNEFKTSYAPDRPEIVYCEQCYQQEVI